MTDFLNQELNVGDQVVFIINRRTGSSTIRKVMSKGIIARIMPQKIELNYFSDKEEIFRGRDQIFPCDCVKIEWNQKGDIQWTNK